MVHPLHIHFGSGSIGLGVAVPCLLQDRRLIVSHIFQERTDGEKWRDWFTGKGTAELRIAVPGEPNQTERVGVLFPGSAGFDKQEMERVLEDQAVDLVMLGVNETEIVHLLPVLAEAASFSTAVGDGQAAIAEVLSRSAAGLEERPILLFENDASQDLLELPRFNAIPLVVDRICTRRDPDESGWFVRCEAKPEPQVIGPDVPEVASFRAVKCVKECLMPYLGSRKRALVNHVHQFVAILAYHYLRELRIEGKRWENQSLGILTDAILSPRPTGGRNYRAILGILIGAEAMMVTLDTDLEIRRELFKTDREREVYEALKAEGRDSVKRFQRFANDLIGRVLRVENQERLLVSTGKYLQEFTQSVMDRKDAMRGFQAGNAPPVDHVLSAISFMNNAVEEVRSYLERPNQPTDSR